ncbi:hypothetical protein K1719_041995 [Acacia pycnantha]|nr:hypothetical protein K1719_041995 [Acacia pycnantha]
MCHLADKATSLSNNHPTNAKWMTRNCSSLHFIGSPSRPHPSPPLPPSSIAFLPLSAPSFGCLPPSLSSSSSSMFDQENYQKHDNFTDNKYPAPALITVSLASSAFHGQVGKKGFLKMDSMHSFWQLGDELRGHSKTSEDHKWLMVASKLAEQTRSKGERVNNLDLSKGPIETRSRDKFGIQEDNKFDTLNFSMLNLESKFTENVGKSSLRNGVYNMNVVYPKTMQA